MSATLSIVIGLVVALIGGGGIVALLRFNREEATGYIDIMRGLNDEMQESLERARAERDELGTKVVELTKRTEALSGEVDRLTRLLRQNGIHA